LIKLNTSLREISPEETLDRARCYFSKLGISRLTESTYLDRIGLPVFSCIRPASERGSVCVHSGKGLTRTEAKVSAAMEAIEFGFAEVSHSDLDFNPMSPQKILGEKSGDEAILKLCPKLNARIDLNKQIYATKVFDLISESPCYVPSELVFTPFNSDLPKYFGSHTNGLCSGNRTTEASIHGIFEIIERDVISFNNFKDESYLVEFEGLPNYLMSMINDMQLKGFELVLKFIENSFEIPVFACWIIEPLSRNPIYINAGYGCHISKSIAMVRAITECIQSRLSFVHGGRDDLINDYHYYGKISEEKRHQLFEETVHKVKTSRTNITYPDIPEKTWDYQDLDELLSQLLGHLYKLDFNQVLQAVHTKPEDLIQVVKVIIPGMEFFTPGNRRVGDRLNRFLNSM